MNTENNTVVESAESESTVESMVESLVDGIVSEPTTGGLMDTFEAETEPGMAESADGDGEDKRIFIMVTMQQDKALFDLIDADAKAESIGRAAMARKLLAKAYNYTLNESAGRTNKKYATEEEKVAARKAAAKTRNEEVKLLREQHKINQEIKALKAAGKEIPANLTERLAEIETELFS